MLRLCAIASSIVFALALIFVPARAATASAPLLSLDPQKGPPGTAVRVTPILTTPGECVPFWDNQQGVRFSCGAGPNEVLPWTTLTVPAEATPGPHTITVCSPNCGGIDPAWTVSAVFTVSAVVPRLISLSLPEARDTIERAGLVLGGVQGPSNDPAARVVDQAPPPGTAVDPKSAVTLTIAVPSPQTVVSGHGKLPRGGQGSPR